MMTMDPETVKYILRYYAHLMDAKLRLTFHHTQTLYKYKKTAESNDTLTRHYRELGWIKD